MELDELILKYRKAKSQEEPKQSWRTSKRNGIKISYNVSNH